MNVDAPHIQDRLIAAYVRPSLDDVTRYSIEAHLDRCGECRARVAEHARQPRRAEALWAEIADVVDRPRPTPAARVLAAFGVPEHRALVLAATWPMSVVWVLAQATIVTAGVYLTRTDHAASGILPFLLLAPLLPAASVALTSLARLDPGGEARAAAPLSGTRLALARAVTVFVPSVVLLAAASPFLDRGWLAAAWILPTLGLTLATLALGSFIGVDRAAISIAFGWLLACTVAAVGASGGHELSQHLVDLLAGDGQLVTLGIAVAGAIVTWTRRDHLEPAFARRPGGSS